MSNLVSMFNNLSIKIKLIASFSLIMIIMAIISGMSFLKSSDYAESSDLSKFMIHKEIDHLKWASAIKDLFVHNDDHLNVQTDPHKCGLGSWYYTFIESDEFQGLPGNLQKQFMKIEEPHRLLHETAIELGDEYRQLHHGLESILRTHLDNQRKWAARVSVELIQSKRITQVSDPEKCSLGVWLNSNECQHYMNGWPEFAALVRGIKPPHDAMHKSVLAINQAGSSSTKNRIYLSETLPQLDILSEYFDKMIELEGNNQAGQDLAREIMLTEIEPKLAEVIGLVTGALEGLDEQANGARTTMNATILVGLLGGLIASILLVITLSKGIVVPTLRLMNAMEHLGENDLTVQVDIASEDEIGRMAKIFNVTVQKLKEVMESIANSSKEVATASTQISASSEQMAAGSEEQQAQLSEVAISVEEMSAMILQTSTNAEGTQENAGGANQSAVRGREKVSETVSGIDGIVSIVNDTATQISALKSRSQEIGEVIQVIDDIADQTNLLALNANIEAARAGDAGRGFAVVADEVRKLAERTVGATGDIDEQISQIQTDVASAVDAMAAIIEKSNQGQELAGESGTALSEIGDAIDAVNSAITQIASAAVQQSAGVEEISKNVEGISTVSKQSASSAQELATSAEQLNREVQVLEQQIGQFKI